jgi:hypothetical protein
MDSAALQELIAQIRGTKTALAETEQKVAAYTSVWRARVAANWMNRGRSMPQNFPDSKPKTT